MVRLKGETHGSSDTGNDDTPDTFFEFIGTRHEIKI